MAGWFDVHRDGLRQIAERLVERRGFGIVGAELYQNVRDTKATRCDMTVTNVPGRPLCELIVEDNDPTGFKDLSHAWTLFAPSEKKADPEQAGRFNMGEKVVLSFCTEATIATTCGTVEFTEADGRQEFPRRKRDVGTKFRGLIRCNQERYDQLIAHMHKILVRQNLRFYVNGSEVIMRAPTHTFKVKLPTEIGDDLRPSVRETSVFVYECRDDETAMLYELGIPVVETDDRWHYDICQKVPLNVDRDNVTPAYLKKVRVAVLNEMHNRLTEDDTTEAWVQEAADDENCSNEAAETFRVKKYGEKSVAHDPTNPEANAEAAAHGYTVIPARGLSAGQRNNLYRAGTLKSSSVEFPLAGKGAYSNNPNAKPVEVIPPDQRTDGMRMIHEYTCGVAERLIGKSITLEFVNCRSFEGKPLGACYGRAYLFGQPMFHYNVAKLGRGWFDHGATETVDNLIIHELGHETESNHLSEAYYDALTSLGAKLKAAVMKDYDWFKKFIKE